MDNLPNSSPPYTLPTESGCAEQYSHDSISSHDVRDFAPDCQSEFIRRENSQTPECPCIDLRHQVSEATTQPTDEGSGRDGVWSMPEADF